jgi:hypothetical protein
MPFRLRIRAFTDPDACWLWPGRLTPDGYATTRYRGETTRVHRAAYMEMVGPIPDGLDIDHTCHVRHCMNPAHLRPLDRSTNSSIKRPPRFRPRMTHCRKGHPLTEENSFRYRVQSWNRSDRECRTCRNTRNRQRHADNSERLNARRRELYAQKKSA